MSGAPVRGGSPARRPELREIRADLHVHTCLSPCGDLEMVPTEIVRKARARGLEVIAVCDHNATDNGPAVARAGGREGVSVIPGIEVTTREEVHILGLFETGRQLTGIQALIDRHLAGENDPDTFGLQVVVDEEDEPIALKAELLIGATDLPLEEVVDAIHGLGGLAVAAHVDRERFGIIGQLGFVPPGLPLDALEVSPSASQSQWAGQHGDVPVITSSDAHFLSDVGRSSTVFFIAEPSLSEIGRAQREEGGRRVLME